ncbi:Plastidal glycolate/glycerate translocator 1 [Spatholobus suberectus]|nr:Plastidal glycolate/glycerate translocator 1 [Spatholobus suberectus]
MGTPESCKSGEICTELLESQTGGTSTESVTQTLRVQVFGVLHWVVSLGLILAMDFLLKKAFAAASVEFPSALFGMFCIFSVLIILDYVVPSAAVALVNFFEPGLMFIQRWLPLLPSSVKKVFHPIIFCAASAELTAVAFGFLSNSGLDPVLGYYLTNSSSNPGAGDILMGFLGSVILSFAFSMFKQRKIWNCGFQLEYGTLHIFRVLVH